MKNRTWMCVGALLSGAFLGVILGCAGLEDQPEGQVQQPGLYALTGWNSGIGDINGEVGHRMDVNGPTANAVPGGHWKSSYRIISGSLPPGLEIDNAHDHIVGIPERRGHWVVVLELYDVSTDDNSYQGFTQELRFHITGSGTVVE